jgi:hypothetical protein
MIELYDVRQKTTAERMTIDVNDESSDRVIDFGTNTANESFSKKSQVYFETNEVARHAGGPFLMPPSRLSCDRNYTQHFLVKVTRCKPSSSFQRKDNYNHWRLHTMRLIYVASPQSIFF